MGEMVKDVYLFLHQGMIVKIQYIIQPIWLVSYLLVLSTDAVLEQAVPIPLLLRVTHGV